MIDRVKPGFAFFRSREPTAELFDDTEDPRARLAAVGTRAQVKNIAENFHDTAGRRGPVGPLSRAVATDGSLVTLEIPARISRKVTQ